MRDGLTIKQEKFVQEYLLTGNASGAYRIAYDANNMSENAVYVEASKLLAAPKITLRLSELRSKIEQKFELKINDIVSQLSDAFLSDVTEYVTPEGIIRAQAIKDMPKEKRRLIESIKAKRDSVELTLMSKIAAIDRLCQIMGWNAPVKSQTESTIRVDTSAITPEQRDALIAVSKMALEE
jgi:phage terminase small subunit